MIPEHTAISSSWRPNIQCLVDFGLPRSTLLRVSDSGEGKVVQDGDSAKFICLVRPIGLLEELVFFKVW